MNYKYATHGTLTWSRVRYGLTKIVPADEVIHVLRQKKIVSLNTHTSLKTYRIEMVSNDKPDKLQPHMSTSTVQSLLLTKPELMSYGVKQRLWIQYR